MVVARREGQDSKQVSANNFVRGENRPTSPSLSRRCTIVTMEVHLDDGARGNADGEEKR